MDARVIVLRDNAYSRDVGRRCVGSADIPIETVDAVRGEDALSTLRALGIKWTWGPGYGSLRHKPYGGDHARRVACFLSHYMLWTECALRDEPMLILEHDAVFIRSFADFPVQDVKVACMINDPRRATPLGDWWHREMEKRGPGIWPKTTVFEDSRPDGLAGNSAYVITPAGALWLFEIVKEIGAWPNDALLCRQLVDGLQEYYPYITEVRSERSTI